MQPEELVDCPDDTVWYNSTVIERVVFKDNDGAGVPIIDYKIGFRIYSEEGTAIDAKSGRSFFGWSS